MDVLVLIKTLRELMLVIPTVMNIIGHYNEISKSDEFTPEDKEKAKALLNSLRWKSFDDIK